MSKFIAVWKRVPFESFLDDRILGICRLLEPDNIESNEPKLYAGQSWCYGIMNPVRSILSNDKGLVMGMFFGDTNRWDQVGAPLPDGTYSVVRNGEDSAEVCTDFAGSRSIWYCFTDSELIVSSSQRAIVMYLGSLEWNEKVIPWMLSTGCLGPYHSWDRRIHLLPGNAILKLDKQAWRINVKRTAFNYVTSGKTDQEIRDSLLSSIERTFSNLDLRKARWAVTLSGGKDSRGVFLLALQKAKIEGKLPTFTYGLKGEEKKKNTDGFIAKRIAEKYGSTNEYFSSFSLSESEAIETVCNRLLKTGEGRVDHILGYLDGMQFWKFLFESGIDGILRGDVAFGFPLDLDFKNRIESQHYGQGFLCREWSNLQSLPKEILNGQEFDTLFSKSNDESYNDHHDRFYVEFRLPFILTALSDFKLSYVELINPLLSRDIFNNIKFLPTHLRKGSPIWKPYTISLEPQIPFANNTSFDLGLNEMDRDEFKKFVTTTIEKSPYLPEYLKMLVRGGEKSNSGVKNLIKKAFRQSALKNLLSFRQRFLLWRWTGGNKKSPKLPNEKIRIRIFIIAEMYRILTEDSRAFQK